MTTVALDSFSSVLLAYSTCWWGDWGCWGAWKGIALSTEVALSVENFRTIIKWKKNGFAFYYDHARANVNSVSDRMLLSTGRAVSIVSPKCHCILPHSFGNRKGIEPSLHHSTLRNLTAFFPPFCVCVCVFRQGNSYRSSRSLLLLQRWVIRDD